MKKTSHTLLSSLALCCVMVSCSPPQQEVTRIPVSSSYGNDRTLAGQVFHEVNSYRAMKGKSSLVRHAGLDSLAQKHCDYLSQTCGGNGLQINHNGFTGRALSARTSFQIGAIGENVVASSTHSANHLLNLWVSSKQHEHNMRSKWKYTGIGTIVTNDGKLISVQIFGSEESSSAVSEIDTKRRMW